MSQSQMAIGTMSSAPQTTKRHEAALPSPEEYFAALDDDGCRAILAATREETLTVQEISERCDLPLSTAYRKLETLTEANLLEESLRIRSSGKHASEYQCTIGDLTVSLDPEDGIQLGVPE